MSEPNYLKPVLTIDQQIELLESCGLRIKDKELAKTILINTNYYRLSAYTLPFETGMKDGRREHKFRHDATLERVFKLYKCDEELRNILLSLIYKIEIYFRSRIAYVLATKYNNPFIIYEKNIFVKRKDNKSTDNMIDDLILSLEKEVNRSQETFVKHFKQNYKEGKENKLPIWATVETISLGTLSRIYKYMLQDDKDIISNELNVPSNILSSWLHTISYIRNICAHNGRLINRFLVIGTMKPDRIINKNINWKLLDNKRIFNFIVTIEYIVKKLKIDEIDSIKKLDSIYFLIDEFLKNEDWMHPSVGLSNNIQSKQFFNDSDIK